MGRRPFGARAMTYAERQQRRRKQLGISGLFVPAVRPWDQERANFQEIRTLDALHTWLQHGDAEQVAKWLADRLIDRDDDATFLDKGRAGLQLKAVAPAGALFEACAQPAVRMRRAATRSPPEPTRGLRIALPVPTSVSPPPSCRDWKPPCTPRRLSPVMLAPLFKMAVVTASTLFRKRQ